MKENGHDWIDILKVDIEGSEFPMFDAIMDDFGEILPFSQLQMEFHVRDDIIKFAEFLSSGGRDSSREVCIHGGLRLTQPRLFRSTSLGF